MVFPVFKILFILVVFLFFCGLQVDCKVERYALRVVENGTMVNEEVEVDVDEQTEVIRVRKQDDVDSLEIMNDFIAGLSARRASANKVCYVSKLDSIFPSPEKMKQDMDQASKQSLSNETTTVTSVRRVLGFANRAALSQKILEFCGAFPIYEIEIKDISFELLKTTMREVFGQTRSKRNHFTGKLVALCSYNDRSKFMGCLKTVGHDNVQYKCRFQGRQCLYVAHCAHRGSCPLSYDYECRYVHQINYSICCTVTC